MADDDDGVDFMEHAKQLAAELSDYYARHNGLTQTSHDQRTTDMIGAAAATLDVFVRFADPPVEHLPWCNWHFQPGSSCDCGVDA